MGKKLLVLETVQPRTSPEKTPLSPPAEDEVFSSENLSLDYIVLEMVLNDPSSCSDDSNHSIQQPGQPTFFFPQIQDTPVKEVCIKNECEVGAVFN